MRTVTVIPTNTYWLRVLAVIGLLLQVLFFRLTGAEMQVGMFWALVLAAINIFHLAWMTRDRISLRLPERDAPLLREALAGLDDEQIARLLRAADWELR